MIGSAIVLTCSFFGFANAEDQKNTDAELATCKVYKYDQDGQRQLIAKCFACNCAALTRAVHGE